VHHIAVISPRLFGACTARCMVQALSTHACNLSDKDWSTESHRLRIPKWPYANYQGVTRTVRKRKEDIWGLAARRLTVQGAWRNWLAPAFVGFCFCIPSPLFRVIDLSSFSRQKHPSRRFCSFHRLWGRFKRESYSD
jgi:hypothetical protein